MQFTERDNKLSSEPYMNNSGVKQIWFASYSLVFTCFGLDVKRAELVHNYF